MGATPKTNAGPTTCILPPLQHAVKGKTSPKAAACGMCKRPHDVRLVQATAFQTKALGHDLVSNQLTSTFPQHCPTSPVS